jgi:general secretion pathway protein F
MPLYRYQALDAQGKKRNGLIEGHSLTEAKERLRDQGVMVTFLSEQQDGGAASLQGEALVAFTLQMSQLVNAGIPLYESLIAIEEQTRQEKYHNVLLSLCEQIKAGSSLSRAMATFPKSFDRLYCGMVAAGESSGALPIVLDRLAFFLNRRMRLKKQITTAMIYPALLAAFALVVIVLLMGFVIPSMESIFMGRSLNWFTELVLNMSNFVRTWWWAYIPLIALAITGIVLKLRSPSGQAWIERISLRLPLIGKLVRQAVLARFCRTMSTLQQGGLTMIDSLRIARSVMGNAVLEHDMQHAEQKIIEGSSLSTALGRYVWIPPLVARMLRIGEESGTLQTMFGHIADMYEEEMEKNIERLLALAQPAILLTMGVIIGAVLMAVLLPLADVSSLAG